MSNLDELFADQRRRLANPRISDQKFPSRLSIVAEAMEVLSICNGKSFEAAFEFEALASLLLGAELQHSVGWSFQRSEAVLISNSCRKMDKGPQLLSTASRAKAEQLCAVVAAIIVQEILHAFGTDLHASQTSSISPSSELETCTLAEGWVVGLRST